MRLLVVSPRKVAPTATMFMYSMLCHISLGRLAGRFWQNRCWRIAFGGGVVQNQPEIKRGDRWAYKIARASENTRKSEANNNFSLIIGRACEG